MIESPSSPPVADARPSLRTRLVLSLAIALVYGIVVALDYAYSPPTIKTDFDQIWFAAKAVLHGDNPYPLIGPGRAFDGPWPLYYPLMAPLAVLPVGWLTEVASRVVVAAVPTGLLVFLLTRESLRFLPLFASAAYFSSIKLVQWPPLLACALYLPWLGFLAAAKPNLGLAVLAGARSVRDATVMAVMMALITLVAFVVQPDWFGHWRDAVQSAPHFRSYLLVPGGQLLLLSLLRWRLPEGRLFAALAIVPQTPSLTTAVLVLLIPTTRTGVAMLALLTYIPFFAVQLNPAASDFAVFVDKMEPALLYAVYLPALVFLLRRPNVGVAPDFVERLIAPLPSWLRGTATPAASAP